MREKKYFFQYGKCLLFRSLKFHTHHNRSYFALLQHLKHPDGLQIQQMQTVDLYFGEQKNKLKKLFCCCLNAFFSFYLFYFSDLQMKLFRNERTSPQYPCFLCLEEDFRHRFYFLFLATFFFQKKISFDKIYANSRVCLEQKCRSSAFDKKNKF
jgi:hypothetical protein